MILTSNKHSMHMKKRAEPTLYISNKMKYKPKSILIFYQDKNDFSEN